MGQQFHLLRTAGLLFCGQPKKIKIKFIHSYFNFIFFIKLQISQAARGNRCRWFPSPKTIFKGTSFLVMLVQVYSIEIIQLGTILHTIVKPNNTCNWFLSSWLERTTPLLRFTVWCSVLIGWWEPWSLIGSGSSTIYSSSSTISSRKGTLCLL